MRYNNVIEVFPLVKMCLWWKAWYSEPTSLREETGSSVLCLDPASKDNVRYNVITQIDRQQKERAISLSVCEISQLSPSTIIHFLFSFTGAVWMKVSRAECTTTFSNISKSQLLWRAGTERSWILISMNGLASKDKY